MPLLKKRYLPAAIIAAVFLALCLAAWRLHNPPVLYRMTLLPPHTRAWKLNDHGQAVGCVYENGHTRLFLWDRTQGVQDLGFAGWDCTINNAGQIAGTMATDPNSPRSKRAFLWECGEGKTMLGTLGGGISLVLAMNNRGQIVGISDTADGSPHMPFSGTKKLG